MLQDGGGEDTPARMEQREVSFVPGLYKIFDEILVNACDHKVRDPKMDQLRVDIDAGSGSPSSALLRRNTRVRRERHPWT